MSGNTGSCLCGNIKIDFEGDPAMHALCHCGDCKKISGSTFSNNVVVQTDGFKNVSGTPKTFTKTADSGKKITSFFCGDCGTTVYRQGETFGPLTIIKAGVLDSDKWQNAKPQSELFAPKRSAWDQPLSEAQQVDAMPS